MSTEDGENPADLAEVLGEEVILTAPNERRLITQPLDLSVQTLCDHWKEGLLILPDMQREYLWDNGKASRLIESLLLNIPIPVLYFSETDDAKYEIFDGHQRTKSIVRYINNEFPLVGLPVLSEHKSKRFHELPQKDQRFLRMRTLRVILITNDSHPNMKFEIYERLNTGSILLNAQELRKSIYRGHLNDLLSDLAKSAIFRSLIGTKMPRARMVDEEMILRFLAMRDRLPTYRPSLKRFLNTYANEQKSKSKLDLSPLDTEFHRAVQNIDQYLGANSAFRVLDDNGNRAEPSVNRALFEAEMLAFNWIAPDQRVEAGAVRRSVGRLFRNENFVDAIQRATGDRSRTLTRVREMVAALQNAGLNVQAPFDLTA